MRYNGHLQGNASNQQANYNSLQDPASKQNASKPQTAMESTCSRLSAAIDESDRLAERLSILECRLLGSGATPGKDAPPRPIPTGHLGQLNSSLDDLAERLSRASETTSRLLDAI